MLCRVTDDVTERRRYAAVQTGGAKDTPAHPIALLCVQGNLGLDHFVLDLLYRYYGPIQRCLQEQDQRGRVAAGG